MAASPSRPGARRLVVFSHPNHEISIYGSLRRLQPDLVYLTDGGGQHRVAETKTGLGKIGLRERARFLDHTEESFYGALLDQDPSLFQRVADQVRAVVDEVEPDEVYCDAVELYNPVHDISLPVVDAALRGSKASRAKVFEVPLVWQRAATPGPKDPKDEFVVQRAPRARSADRVATELDDAERDAKVHARDHVYSLLRGQMGPLLDLPPSYLAHEEVMRRGSAATPAPDAEVGLRYERRARVLLEKGEIDRMITLRDHYLPVAAALRAAPSAARR